MHSRHYLQQDDFTVAFGAEPSRTGGVFADWSPDHRVAVVAPDPAADLVRVAGVVLAWTHRFYERVDVGSEQFVDYPSHYVLAGEHGAEPRMLGPSKQAPWSAAWCRIDVWPSIRHLVAHPDAATMATAALMVEPTHLLWPSRLTWPKDAHIRLGPGDAVTRRMLRARLEAVWLYGDDLEGAAGAWRLSWSGGAAQLTQEAVQRLPGSHVEPRPEQWFVSVPTGPFLGVD